MGDRTVVAALLRKLDTELRVTVEAPKSLLHLVTLTPGDLTVAAALVHALEEHEEIGGAAARSIAQLGFF